MSRIPQPVIDQILARVSLVDLIGEYTRVERKGRGEQHMALCPFHREKTPSLSISDAKGVYYCFGCQARGNAITFLQEHNGMSFPEAMEALSRKTGIELPREDVDIEASRQKRKAEEAYVQVMRTAMEFYRSQLWGKVGEAGQRYLRSRGIDEETAHTFRLGFAPDSWNSLLEHAHAQGVSGSVLERAGLAIQRDSGGYYDRFRGRIMFPVLDVSGRCLAFSGRALDSENPAKYINSPETRFYKKGRHLFGLHAARKAIRAQGNIVLVEGNFDVVSLHAHGIEQTVAPLGTALTDAQCHLLTRFSDTVLMAFDGDQAGNDAADKAFLTLLGEGVTDIRKIEFSEGEDPDDLVRSEGGHVLLKRVSNARSMIESTLDDVLTPAVGSRDPAARRTALMKLGELLSVIDDDILARTTAHEASRRLDMDIGTLRKAAAQARSQSRNFHRNRTGSEGLSNQGSEGSPSLTTLEIGLLRGLHGHPDRLKVIREYHLYSLLKHRKLAKTLEEATKALMEDGTVNITTHMEGAEDPTLIRAWYEAGTDSRGFVLRSEESDFESIILELLIAGLKRKIKTVDRKLTSEYRTGDMDDVRPLLQRREELARAIDELRGEVQNR